MASLKERQPKEFGHGGKRSAVNGAGAEFFEQRQVLRRRVALVALKPILRKREGQGFEQAVACGFGEDGGSRNGEGAVVPLNEGRLRAREVVQMPCVHQAVLRLYREGKHSALHGQPSCLKNVEAVNFFDAGLANGMGQALRAYLRGQALSLGFRGNFFGVLHTVQAEVLRQHHRSGNNGPGQRRHACFVNAGDIDEGLRPQGFFINQHGLQTRFFRFHRLLPLWHDLFVGGWTFRQNKFNLAGPTEGALRRRSDERLLLFMWRTFGAARDGREDTELL